MDWINMAQNKNTLWAVVWVQQSTGFFFSSSGTVTSSQGTIALEVITVYDEHACTL